MKKLIYLILVIFYFNILLLSCSSDFSSGFAEVNGTSLYYEIKGNGTPMIFIHGFTCDHRNWEPQLDYFSKRYRVITYDLRGHGISALPDTIPYSHTEDLNALMDYLKIEKAVIVGHSLGGRPAFFLTVDHPEKVSALVLAEGGPILNTPDLVDTSLVPEYFNELYSAIKIARKDGLEAGKKAWFQIHPMKDAYENPKSSELLKTMIDDYSGWHWFNRDPQKPEPYGTIELLESIKAPTLIFTGELSHEVLKEGFKVYNEYITNSKLVAIKKSNHMLNIEKPEQFNKELETFLIETNIK